MKILSLQSQSLDEIITAAVECLAHGGLLIYPTETTYGIGVDATNQTAVNILLKYKKRREGKPLSIAVADREMAEKYVDLNKAARTVYANFLPGPVTVVSKGKHTVAFGVESEDGSLGIRIPAHPLALQIVKAFGKPITATGANASYKKRPYCVEDIMKFLSPRQRSFITMVIDAGELPHNEPSTVIDTTLDDIKVLRQGEISFTEGNTFTSNNESETQKLGEKLVLKYKSLLTYKALVFCLVGEMGAGKTQFCKGIARGLGIKETVTSPTYTFSTNYKFKAEGKNTEFIHMDTWRLFNDQEFLDLGFAKMIDECNVIAVEWADRVSEVFKRYEGEAKLIWVKFSYGKQEHERIIEYGDQIFERKI
ncbi:MAG: L-threonylcarbamoyladenylate synthase [Patescibacteria group bacterium]